MNETETTKIACPECGRDNFLTPHALMVHRLKTHKIHPTKGKLRPSQIRNKTMLCDICGKGPFRTKAALGAHRQKKHGINGTSYRSVQDRLKSNRLDRERKKKKKAVQRDAAGNRIYKHGRRIEANGVQVPVVAPEHRYQPSENPVPGCAYCPACGLNLALFHRALEIANDSR